MEAELIGVTVRHSDDPDWIDLECRFTNGEKYVAVQVDAARPELAQRLARLLGVLADVQNHDNKLFESMCLTCHGAGRVATHLGKPGLCPVCKGSGRKQ